MTLPFFDTSFDFASDFRLKDLLENHESMGSPAATHLLRNRCESDSSLAAVSSSSSSEANTSSFQISEPSTTTNDVERLNHHHHNPLRPGKLCPRTSPIDVVPQVAAAPKRVGISPDAVTLNLVLGKIPPTELISKRSHPSAFIDALQGPAAFFPGQRVAFSPRLRVLQSGGVQLDPSLTGSRDVQAYSDFSPESERICGLMLGVTGVVETLAPSTHPAASPVVLASRTIADYCTDLSSGMKIWHNDASGGSASLPAGTFVLPLSLRIPESSKMPPSFESRTFRVRYAMSLGLFKRSASLPSRAKPVLVASAEVPFTMLPSTPPTPAPPLPMLVHTPPAAANSIFHSVVKLMANGQRTRSSWSVQTSIPASSFSPTEVVPITLDVKAPVAPSPPNSTQQIFIRVCLLRRLYLRSSPRSIRAEYGLNKYEEVNDACWDNSLQEEHEISQRWGIVNLPSSGTSEKNAQFTFKDIEMPLAPLSTSTCGGYSTSLNLRPGSCRPTLRHGSSCWFSPMVQTACQTNSVDPEAWDRHVHVSSRFFVAVEIGFFDAPSPSFHRQPFGQLVMQNSPAPYTDMAPRSTASSSSAPTFPGKLRELQMPIIVGSVIEPSSNVLQSQLGSFGGRSLDSWQGEAGGPTSLSEEGSTRTDKNQGHWMIPPPSYSEALAVVPGYQV